MCLLRNTVIGLVSVMGFCLTSLPVLAADFFSIYQSAVTHDPDLQYAHIETLASDEVRKQAFANFLPSASFKASRSQTFQKITSSDNTVFAVGNTNFGTKELTVSLSQPIFHFDSFIGYGQAKERMRKADAELSAARQDMMVRMLDAYLKALFTRDDQVRALREKDAVESEVRLIRARHISGQASNIELKEAEAQMGTVKSLVVEANNALENSLDNLKILAGIPVDNIGALQGDILTMRPEPMDLNKWVKAASEQNFHVQAKKVEVEIAEDEISRQRAGHYPTLDLVGSYNFKDTKGTLFGGGSKVQTGIVGVELNIPLSSGGRVSAKTREALLRSQQAQQELEKTRRQAVRDARKAFTGVESSGAKLVALKQSVVAQEAVVHAREKGVRSGLNTSTGVLNARKKLFIIHRDYAQSRYNYLKNLIRLKRAAGILSEKDMQAVSALFGTNDGGNS